MEDLRALLQDITKYFGVLNKSCCTVGSIDISLVQSYILYEINRQHRPSMQQVAEALRMDITTFSRQIQTLVDKKLVQKTPSQHDKRIYIVSLTQVGLTVTQMIDQQVNDYLHKILSGMNASERETVIRSLKLLHEQMVKSGSCC